MNSRERVFHAFKKREGMPDRVPVEFDLCRQLTDHFGKELGIEPDYAPSYYEDLTYRISANEIRTKMGSDCVVVGGTVAEGFEPDTIKDDITTNEFGMHMKPTNLYVEVVKAPLEQASSVEDIENFSFPDPNAHGRFEHAKRDIDRFGKDYFCIGEAELSLFELAWHMTGMEKYLLAMAMEKPWLVKLNDWAEYWTTELAKQLVKLGVDAVWFGEDLGSQTSTLISPDMWRTMFKPRWVRMIAAVKNLNPDVIVMMHSDGAVAPMLEDWIEMGIEVYNPVQPNVPGSNPEELKSNYGKNINFFGGIDQQELLPNGDPGAITKEIEFREKVLGRDGGYLLAPAHIIQADVRPETVLTMINAAREYGTY
jgi:uroporphyrinogen decarboxylase